MDCSYSACLSSIFSWHNETVNFWSHFGPGVLYIFVTCRHLADSFTSLTISILVDELLVALYTSFVTVMLMFSASYHIFGCNSLSSHKCLARLDFAGIIIAILGSFISALHFTFYCHVIAARFYQGCATSISLVALALYCMNPFVLQLASWSRAGLLHS